ncbi:MAG: phosphorylase [Burkholderiales bacterium]|nr:phosphorylase [Burkholderiales bacterium]
MPLPSLQPGTLWAALTARTERALARGALLPIETVQTAIDDSGLRFVVRQVSSLIFKPRVDTAAPTPFVDPFLPYDPDLFVADISATHVALLNKYNVLPHHLLIVTRAFEPQQALVDLDDFVAWFTCLNEFDGLGFYNGGLEAGASQPHKHMQVVPLPLGECGQSLPLAPLLEAATFDGPIGALPGFPFEHALAQLTPGPVEQAAAQALDRYRMLLDVVGVGAMAVDGRAHHRTPYNLLLTPQWMLLVPRSSEAAAGISINSLGFAGSFFVKDAEQLAALRRIGPMTLLLRVGLPRRRSA